MDLILGPWPVLSVITAILLILLILVIICLQRKTWAYWPPSVKSAIEIPTQGKSQHSPKLAIPDELVGLEGVTKIIMDKLQTSRRFGIVGMGGIGKTTLAKILYNNISQSFDCTCFLKDVKRIMAGENSAEFLKEKILEKLCYEGREVGNTFTWDMLKNKKVLIVLDDVEREYHVLGIRELDSFLDGSRIIATSRNIGLLSRERFELHVMDQLDVQDSIRLFCLHAFGRENALNSYKDHVMRFAEKCGGLPLALTVVGKDLRGQFALELWDEVLEKLKEAKPIDGSENDGLWSILRVSYDSLAKEEREMFLDVATCFHGEDLYRVKKAWRVCGWASPESGLKNLLDKGSVTIDNFATPTQSRFTNLVDKSLVPVDKLAAPTESGRKKLLDRDSIEIENFAPSTQSEGKTLVNTSVLSDENFGVPTQSSLESSVDGSVPIDDLAATPTGSVVHKFKEVPRIRMHPLLRDLGRSMTFPHTCIDVHTPNMCLAKVDCVTME